MAHRRLGGFSRLLVTTADARGAKQAVPRKNQTLVVSRLVEERKSCARGCVHGFDADLASPEPVRGGDRACDCLLHCVAV
jgi:hypothetical protein